ncbi:hypothetical protein CDN99_04560 [Roseateles aquatilis]|uniref:diguanylate cyclase n=1 Tax=Roseateles aquatilis TaxID=431061 RepID=A0A246JM88_9BURK|nr:diguanylate cyclase [Roseateles aquatilis]OWQ93727.1 hypothetical protein CDN99_04560 [Roseateles aquatilis]
MRTLRRLDIVLFSGLTTVYACMCVGFYLHLQSEYERDLRDAALRQMDVAQAVRQFTTEHVRETLLKDAAEFHPASVPSFAANQTMQYLHTLHPGQLYREVALNPMNPKNRATGWEVLAIDQFRKTRASEFSAATEDGRAMHFARPITVSSTSCLACHGSPALAPTNLLDRYGPVHGFGWQSGEVVGAQVVSIPTGPLQGRRNQHLTYYLGVSLLAFAAGFAALRRGLRRRVLDPIQKAGNAWRKLASEDALTGAASRRSVLDVLDLLTGPGAEERAVSVIFVDLDNFKLINDTHGHLAGDQILREVTQRIDAVVREADVIGRYGGEELLVVLPACKRKIASARAHALRQAVAATPFRVVGLDGVRRDVPVTASFGVAEWLPGESTNELLARADAALYRAKSSGRNAVKVARQDEELRTNAPMA